MEPVIPAELAWIDISRWIWAIIIVILGSINQKNREVAEFHEKLHPHIVCGCAKQRYVQTGTFFRGKKLFKSYVVPGKTNLTEIEVTGDIFRRFLIGLFFRFEHLHKDGKSLNGLFTAQSIYMLSEDVPIASHMDIKFDNLTDNDFKSYTEEGGNSDLSKLGRVIENDILSPETKLPPDLKQLLDLLISNPVSKKPLILSHVSLKCLKDKLSHYMWVYKRLLHLKKKCPDKYENIMKKICVDGDWRKKAEQNKHLDELCPIVPKNGKGGYSKDGKGLTRFYRNSVEHLTFGGNNSNLPQENKETNLALEPAKEEGFNDYYAAIVLLEAFPKFLGLLQEAVFDENELENCNAEGSTTDDEEMKTDEILMMNDETGKNVAKVTTRDDENDKQDDDNENDPEIFTDDFSDSDSSESDSETSSGTNDHYETPVLELDKKRDVATALETVNSYNKEKILTPKDNGDKKGVHIARSYKCKSCNRNFKSIEALKTHKKAKKHW